jgi:hypothetical protein
MKKRLISLLVALCMAVTLLPVSALTAWAEGGDQLRIVDGYPVGSGGEGWSYDGTTLDLHPASSTEYDFLSIISGNGNVTKCKLTIGGNATIVRGNFDNTVINNGKISGGYFYSSSPLTNHGTIIDGLFVSAVSNESEGKIENGTFRSTVTNNGIIKGGIFSEQPAGGTVASGYTLNINFPENGSYEIIDAGISYFGNSGYVIPNSNHNTSISIYIFFRDSQAILFPIDVTFGDTHCLLEDWAPSARYYDNGSDYFSVTFTAPHADADTVTLSILTRLVIDKAGYPVGTEGGTQDYSGNGWRFEKSNKTLTLESGDYSFWEQSEVNCPVIIKDGVTTIGGMFSKKVTNYGTVEKAVINNIFENRNTVKNSYFFNSSSSIAVTNHGDTMLDCLFENAPEGIESHTITEVEDYFISAELDGIAYQAIQTKFYFTGTPKLRVNLVKDGHVKPVTSINQKLNYGELIEDYPVGYIFTVENDNEDVVLNQGTYPTLKMASNGTPIIDGAYYSTIESNIPTYFGDSWHCQKAMDSVGTLYLENGTYDFRSTDPVNKNGEPLNAVICSIVNEGGTIEDGTFSKPIVNGQPGSTSSEPHVIEGGTFAAGLLYNDGVITGGAFNGKDSVLNKLSGSTVVSDTALSGDYRSVTVNGGAIVKVNDTFPLVPGETGLDLVQGSAWDLYSYAGTVLTVESNVDITNINGQEIGEAFTSYYPNGKTNKKVVCFEMPDSDVELNSTKIVVPDPKPEPEPKPEPKPEPTPDPTYTLTVKGGTFSYNGSEAMTSASVPVDAEVKVTLNQSAVPEGMVFDLWAMDEASLLGNPAVAYNQESFTIPAGSVAKGSTVTVEAQYRDATIESEPSILGTAAIIGVAGAGTAVIVWQGYRIGMELYEKYFQPTPEETAAEQPAPEAPAAAAAS